MMGVALGHRNGVMPYQRTTLTLQNPYSEVRSFGTSQAPYGQHGTEMKGG